MHRLGTGGIESSRQREHGDLVVTGGSVASVEFGNHHQLCAIGAAPDRDVGGPVQVGHGATWLEREGGGNFAFAADGNLAGNVTTDLGVQHHATSGEVQAVEGAQVSIDRRRQLVVGDIL